MLSVQATAGQILQPLAQASIKCAHGYMSRVRLRCNQIAVAQGAQLLTHAFVLAGVEPAEGLHCSDELSKVQATILVGIKQLEDPHNEGVACQFRD